MWWAVLGLVLGSAFAGAKDDDVPAGDDAAPDRPVPPVEPIPSAPGKVCNVLIEADGKQASLCQTGDVWRVAKDGDELEPHKYTDAGKAAQRILQLLNAGAAKHVRISTPKGIAVVDYTGPSDYRWTVDILATAGEVNRIGRAPTMLDALGEAYEAAGGIV